MDKQDAIEVLKYYAKDLASPRAVTQPAYNNRFIARLRDAIPLLLEVLEAEKQRADKLEAMLSDAAGIITECDPDDVHGNCINCNLKDINCRDVDQIKTELARRVEKDKN